MHVHTRTRKYVHMLPSPNVLPLHFPIQTLQPTATTPCTHPPTHPFTHHPIHPPMHPTTYPYPPTHPLGGTHPTDYLFTRNTLHAGCTAVNCATCVSGSATTCASCKEGYSLANGVCSLMRESLQSHVCGRTCVYIFEYVRACVGACVYARALVRARACACARVCIPPNLHFATLPPTPDCRAKSAHCAPTAGGASLAQQTTSHQCHFDWTQ